VLVAPDSFKGSLNAREAAEALAEGIREARPSARIDPCPMADGGEGTLDVLLAAHRGRRRRVAAHTPDGRPRDADVGLIDQASTAVVELAAIAGLPLVRAEQRDPLRLTTHGVGELIAAVFDAQVERLILTVGGSATVDGGAGIAQALGVRLFDSAGRALPSPLPPARLTEAARIDASAMIDRRAGVDVTIAVDVLNPLLGPHGAAAVFGPQKGADAEGVRRLEAALAHWVGVLERASGRALRHEPGTGAAGGAALPLLAFAGASIVPGVDLVIDAVRLRDRLAATDLVLTGEGRLDEQSLMGKVVGAVARLSRAAGVRCVAIVGALGSGHDQVARLFDEVVVLAQPGERIEAAMREARERLRRAAAGAVGERPPG